LSYKRYRPKNLGPRCTLSNIGILVGKYLPNNIEKPLKFVFQNFFFVPIIGKSAAVVVVVFFLAENVLFSTFHCDCMSTLHVETKKVKGQIRVGICKFFRLLEIDKKGS